MGTILVPLFAHYRPAPAPVQAAVAGGLLKSTCVGARLPKARTRRRIVDCGVALSCQWDGGHNCSDKA